MTAWESEKRVHMIVGDVHGCLDALLDLERQIQAHCAQVDLFPFIVLVGDLVDRGSQSLEVVRHVMKGVQQKTHLCLAGNHEALFLELIAYYCSGGAQNWVRGASSVVPLFEQHAESRHSDAVSLAEYAAWRKNMWLAQGGLETLRSFGQSEDEGLWDFSDLESELRFLASLPLVYCHENVWVSHALASPQAMRWARDHSKFESDFTRTLEEERILSARPAHRERARMIQDLLWSRDPSGPWPSDCPVHVSGHSPHETLVRLDGGRRLQIDTGCVYGNVLTAWCPETGTVFSSAASAHAPVR